MDKSKDHPVLNGGPLTRKSNVITTFNGNCTIQLLVPHQNVVIREGTEMENLQCLLKLSQFSTKSMQTDVSVVVFTYELM